MIIRCVMSILIKLYMARPVFPVHFLSSASQNKIMIIRKNQATYDSQQLQ